MGRDPSKAESGAVGERRCVTRHCRWTLGRKGALEVGRADCESVRNRTEWKSWVVLWFLRRTRPYSRVVVSAVKLEAGWWVASLRSSSFHLANFKFSLASS